MVFQIYEEESAGERYLYVRLNLFDGVVGHDEVMGWPRRTADAWEEHYSASAYRLLVIACGPNNARECDMHTTWMLAIAVLAAGSVLPAALAGAATERVVYSFQGGADGANPRGGLIDLGGTLYGTTSTGGAANDGTVYKVTLAGVETVLHTLNNRDDGAQPWGELIDVNGKLFGTTAWGGNRGSGTAFSITLEGAYHLLHTFGRKQDGAHPYSGLVNVGGTLYGTTYWGGETRCGTIYKMTKQGAETVVWSFRPRTKPKFRDGCHPYDRPTNLDGTIFGTTNSGGWVPGYGTVFKVAPTGAYSQVYSFKPEVGDAYPSTGLTYLDGEFYGTASLGLGSVFKLTLGGAKTVIFDFGGSNGSGPSGDLLDVHGTLYGAASNGGTYNEGVVYSLTTAGVEEVLYVFSGGADGGSPLGSLIRIGGTLYGTSYFGGQYGYGTVFTVTP
jgi:uncharacterized repeat protein (TIGR03803 family)